MNEGRQITKEQAEACMRADSRFEMKGVLYGSYFQLNGKAYYRSSEESWESAVMNKRIGDGWGITIHADPNNTFEQLFGSERELTFEEAWAALGRGETVQIDTGTRTLIIKKPYAAFRFIGTYTDRDAESWEGDWGHYDGYKYTLYQEPTPEPLTLESLEARVKALEEKK